MADLFCYIFPDVYTIGIDNTFNTLLIFIEGTKDDPNG